MKSRGRNRPPKPSKPPKPPKPKIIPRPAHNVSRSEISKSALKVLYRLHKAGFQAFLVGGSVRDALLGLHPKDFDIGTDAHPEEVRALFGNCRLIGRRFRLAHVRFGREVIEVATFRAAADGDEPHADTARDHHGRILRDNVYGSIDEDVWRRDFTCNALYYNIADFSIWDYVGGVRDIRDRRLVLIGDPGKRIREDPVRMLRAVRFAAKLDFRIEDGTAEAVRELTGLLANVPAARLFDEFLKLFQAGHAEKTFALLREYGLFGELFRETDEALERDAAFLKFVRGALVNTDKRVAADKSVTPMFLIGVFLWAPVRRLAGKLRSKEKMSEAQSLAVAAHRMAGLQQSRISIPRRFTAPMREMLALQPRFSVMKGKRALKLLGHRRFRAAYDFMMLRVRTGELGDEVGRFWTDVQRQNAEQRAESFQIGAPHPKRKRRKRPRRRRPAQARQV
ncbi:MAG: polynucleotide adenylyltransferase PcnB [Gammaproteobacteria bacterium]